MVNPYVSAYRLILFLFGLTHAEKFFAVLQRQKPEQLSQISVFFG